MLLGKKCIIKSDNENYSDYIGKELTIVSEQKGGEGYDYSLYPIRLCNLIDSNGDYIPFSLYDFEIKLI